MQKVLGNANGKDHERFPWERPEVYDLTAVPVGPFWDRVYKLLQRLPKGSWVLEAGPGKGRFLLNAPTKRKWSAVCVDCDHVAVSAVRELAGERNWKDVGMLGDFSTELVLLEGYRISACVGMMFFHTISRALQIAVLTRMYESLPVGGRIYAGFLSTQSWRFRRQQELAGTCSVGELVDLRQVMELDSVSVHKSLWFNFADEDYLRKLGREVGFRKILVRWTTEGCGWHHIVRKYGDTARFEPWHGVTFIK